ncbi:hypothetical protein BD413DRAFT_486234 [Trametes elegans]|nr:hypothetical protein BD413DRAFT_486234 [Trametes elegans]
MAAPGRRAAAANSSMLLRIDDTSPRMQYDSGGKWNEAGDQQDYGGTSHASSSTGSSVTFTFNGTFVAVYGSLSASGSSSSYKVDDGTPVTTNVLNPPSPQHNWPFFSSPPLQPGLHELVITVLGGTFELDYVEYTSLNGDDSAGDASPSSAQPAGSPAQGSSGSSPGLPPGAIAGMAIGMAVMVILAASAMFYVRRRRSARKVRHQSHLPEKGIDVLFDAPPKQPQAGSSRSPFRRLSRIYRPTPAKSAQSSKTATSSAPTSVTQSSAMFTSVIIVSPALSMVSEESSQQGDPAGRMVT